MIHYPDHVAKSLVFKLQEIEGLENKIGIQSGKIIKARRRQHELLGEIRGMLQAEEYENELGRKDSAS